MSYRDRKMELKSRGTSRRILSVMCISGVEGGTSEDSA